MAYAKTSLRKEKRELREKMRGLGLGYRDVAVEFMRRYGLRPRAAWREAYGWSQQEAADRVNEFRGQVGLDPGGFAGMTAPHLCEHENWPGYGPEPSGRRPTPYLLALLAAVYDCTVIDLIDLADRERLPPEDLLILDKYSQPAAQSLQLKRRETYQAPSPQGISRREVPAAARSLAAEAILPASPAIPSVVLEGPVAPELVTYFRSQLAGHYAADRFLGPGRLIPVAGSQYELLCDVAGAATGAVRNELWSVAAGFSALLGWLHQDAGDLAASARWHDVMIERAHRSHDPQLVGFSLHCKAMLQADMGDGRGVLDLTGAGLAQPGLIPKVRVLLLQQAAHGWSLAGGDDAAGECDRLLGAATAIMGDVDDDYPWGACKSPRYIDVQRATVRTRLGRHREAAALWEDVIPGMPESSRRDLGVFSARHAQALAGMGEPEHAVMIVRSVVPVAAQSGSARMWAELAVVRSRMEPWRGSAPWRELEEALAALPRARKEGS